MFKARKIIVHGTDAQGNPVCEEIERAGLLRRMWIAVTWRFNRWPTVVRIGD